jgi:hypothetical protein
MFNPVVLAITALAAGVTAYFVYKKRVEDSRTATEAAAKALNTTREERREARFKSAASTGDLTEILDAAYGSPDSAGKRHAGYYKSLLDSGHTTQQSQEIIEKIMADNSANAILREKLRESPVIRNGSESADVAKVIESATKIIQAIEALGHIQRQTVAEDIRDNERRDSINSQTAAEQESRQAIDWERVVRRTLENYNKVPGK